jgi:hypothetical protein
MNRWIATAAMLALALPVTHGAPVDPSQTNPRITTHLAVDGKPCGPVKQWQGGDMRLAEVGQVAVGPDKFQVTASVVACAPVSFEVLLPAAEPVMELMRDMCEGGTRTTTLVLSDMPLGSTTPAQALEISSALLTEIRFSALDAGSKELLSATLVFQGASSRATDKVTSSTTTTPQPRATAVHGLRVQIPKVDASRVSRIEAFTIKRPFVSAPLGTAAKSTTASPGRVVFPHLFATVAFTDSRGLTLWRDEAIAARSPLERDSTLTVIDPTGADVLTFHLTRLGMVGVGVVPVGDQAQRKMQVELSCERIVITVPAAPPPGAAARRSV